jgi:hypothetical protein
MSEAPSPPMTPYSALTPPFTRYMCIKYTYSHREGCRRGLKHLETYYSHLGFSLSIELPVTPVLPVPPNMSVNPGLAGSVANPDVLPPPSERVCLIRINRELKGQPVVLGGTSTNASSLTPLADFHSSNDGRLYRSVLIESIPDFAVTTASFQYDTWKCISCSTSHPILPTKRNAPQWGGGRKIVFLSDQCLPAIMPSKDCLCPAIFRVAGGGGPWVRLAMLSAPFSLIMPCRRAAYS